MTHPLIHRWNPDPAYASLTPAGFVLSPIHSCLKFSAVYEQGISIIVLLGCFLIEPDLRYDVVEEVKSESTGRSTTDGDVEVYDRVGHFVLDSLESTKNDIMENKQLRGEVDSTGNFHDAVSRNFETCPFMCAADMVYVHTVNETTSLRERPIPGLDQCS